MPARPGEVDPPAASDVADVADRPDVADVADVPARSAKQRQRSRRLRRALIVASLLVAAGALIAVVSTVGIDGAVERILTLPRWLVLTVVFLLPALEAAAFVGVVFPGEIAVLLGGVAASRGTVSLAEVLVAAAVGAVAGDQVGYFVGRKYGEELLRRIPDRLLDEDKLQAARSFIRRLGAKGVILGRWTAALRALVPGLSGMAHMHYTRFLIANVIGGVLWAVVVGVVGYEAGDQWPKVQSAVGNASYVVLAVVVVALAAAYLVRRRRRPQERARGPHEAE